MPWISKNELEELQDENDRLRRGIVSLATFYGADLKTQHYRPFIFRDDRYTSDEILRDLDLIHQEAIATEARKRLKPKEDK